MKDPNPHDPINMIGEAYELFVEKAMHDLHVADGKDSTKPAKPIYRLTNPSDTITQQSNWIENKKFLIKNSALEYLGHAGDKTTVTLKRLNQIPSASDKSDKNEKNISNKLPDHSVINTSPYSAKYNAHQYKKCHNKSFRRLQ